MAGLGAHVTVTDLSAAQLAANAERVRAAGCEDNVDARFELDVRDLSRFADGEFDVTVAFGGPLSYVFEAAPQALAGLLRVTRPGGHALASVMSLLGTWKYFLPGVIEDEVTYGAAASDRVLDSGRPGPVGGVPRSRGRGLRCARGPGRRHPSAVRRHPRLLMLLGIRRARVGY